MVQIALEGVAVEAGTGAAIGLIAGYAAKKITKLIAIVAGAGLLGAAYLESRGIIGIDWTGVGNGFVDVGADVAEAAPSLLDTVISTVGVGGGFAVGFLLGFRQG
ncbi:MAG: FUN14 domain-containing protein [Candidatus Nanohaloarchaea archaeon]|nr:FUN14 domain-containing protein [Candidatus Nanohaloarchaea archaeon]